MVDSIFEWEDQLDRALSGHKDTQSTIELEEGERRKVAVLFLDIQGFTTLSQHLDPEEARRIADTALQVFSGIVKQYGGQIDKLLGDGMMALFGSEHATENDLDQAILTGLECIRRLQDVNERLREKSLSTLNIRIGINYGEVVVGRVAGQRGSDTVMGAVVNMASRMESNAQLNRILLPNEAFQLTRRQYESSEPYTIKVKGFDEEIEVREVFGIKNIAEMEPPTGTFVGRQPELQQLKEWLSQTPKAVVLTGPAGIGKTRLAVEVLYDSSIPVIVLRPPAAVPIPFGFIAILIRRILGLSKLQLTVSDLEAALQPFDLGANGTTDAIALLLGVRKPGSKLSKLSGEALFRELVAAIRTLFAKLPDQTACWVFEDGQWGDEVSYRMLADSIDAITAPIWRLMILRNKEEFTLPPRIEQSPTLSVRELTTEEIDELISVQIPGCELPRRITELWRERASGSPLILLELGELLKSTEHLVQDSNGQWKLHGWIEDFSLPASLDGLYRSRFDQLDASQKRWIELAALEGAGFRRDIVEYVGNAISAGLPEWDSLIKSGWIHPIQEGFGRFTTPLAQEVAYSYLLKSNRETLHRFAAEAYEKLYPDRIEEFSPILARHWTSANEPEKAMEALIRWRRTAIDRYDMNSALTAAQKTEAFLAENSPNRKNILHIECKLDAAKLRRLLTDYSQADALLSECIALFDDSIDNTLRARVRYELSYLRHDQSRLSEAVDQIQAALELCDQGTAEETDCKLRLANFLLRVGRVKEGLEIAEGCHHGLPVNAEDSVVASVHLSLGFLYKLSGRYEEARSAFIESAEASKRQGDRLNMALALAGLADYYRDRKEFDRAILIFREVIDNYEKIGDKVRSIRARSGLSGVYVLRKEFSKAEEILRTASEQAEQMKNRMLQQTIHNSLGVIAGMQGHFAKAEEQFRESEIICRAIGERQYLIQALSNLTQIASLRGCWSDVLKNTEELIELCRESGNSGGLFSADLFRAQALMMGNDAEKALEILQAHIENIESPRYPLLLSAIALAKTMLHTPDAEAVRHVAFEKRVADDDTGWLLRYHSYLLAGKPNEKDCMPEETLIAERAALIRAKCTGNTHGVEETMAAFQQAGANGFIEECQIVLANHKS